MVQTLFAFGEPVGLVFMQATFFDTLSPDDIKGVLRYFSDKPNTDNWLRYIRFDEIHNVYVGDVGIVSDTCHSIFEGIRTLVAPLDNESGKGLLDIPACDPLLQRLLKAGGYRITKLELHHPPSLRGAIACPRLQELTIHARVRRHGDLKAIMRASNGSLTSISIGYRLRKKDLIAIEQYCPRLQKLEIRAVNYDLHRFLTAVGPGLKHLGIFGFVTTAKLFEQVQVHCQGLHSLKVEGVDIDLNSDLVAFVVSYSTKLQFFEFGHRIDQHWSNGDRYPDLSPLEYNEISVKCPNVDISLLCTWEGASYAMASLGKRLVRLYLFGDDASNEGTLRYGAQLCNRLRHIEVVSAFGEGEESLDAILPILRGTVKSLQVHTLEPQFSDGPGILPEEYGLNDIVQMMMMMMIEEQGMFFEDDQHDDVPWNDFDINDESTSDGSDGTDGIGNMDDGDDFDDNEMGTDREIID